MDESEKVRENRLRETARRRGYQVSKSRLRDPLAIGYGRWTVTGPTGQVSPAGGWTVDEVEGWLAVPDATVEISLEAGAAEAECRAVAGVLESVGVRATVRADMIRHSVDLLPWIVEIGLGWPTVRFLAAAAAAAGDEAGRDGWKGFKRVIGRLYEARKDSPAPRGGVTLRELDGVTIQLPPDLPDEAYRRLFEIEELRAPLSGVLRWDDTAKEWADALAGRLTCNYPACSAWATQSRVHRPAPNVVLMRSLCDQHAAATHAGDMTAFVDG